MGQLGDREGAAPALTPPNASLHRTNTLHHLPVVLDPARLPPSERIELMKNRLDYAAELDALDAYHPKTRRDCADVPRPCPFVSCRWNLYLDVDARGVVTIPRPDVPPEERRDSCALDVVDREPDGLEAGELAQRLGVSRDAVRGVEARAQAAVARDRDLADALDAPASSARPTPAVDSCPTSRWQARPAPTNGDVRHRLSAAMREKAILDVLDEGPATTAELVERLRGMAHPATDWRVRHVCRILRARERVVLRWVHGEINEPPVIRWVLASDNEQSGECGLATAPIQDSV